MVILLGIILIPYIISRLAAPSRLIQTHETEISAVDHVGCPIVGRRIAISMKDLRLKIAEGSFGFGSRILVADEGKIVG
ncbi:MAG: hypothetical protein AAF585_04545 [Verrucomicrobiota bacterium]